MASTISYGEVIYETSRAFADDEDEELDPDFAPTLFGVSLEKTEAGEAFVKERKDGDAEPKGTLCIFSEKIAVGFGQGFLTSKDTDANYELLGHIEFVGKEGTVDSLLERPRKKIVARIIRIKPRSKSGPMLLFALIDSYGIPRSYAHEIMEQLQVFILAVGQVVIFHNEPLALFQGGQELAEGRLFYVKNNSYNTKWITKSANPLPQPNLIAGITASVLTHCEMIDKPGLILVTYVESDLVDSISVKPFIDAMKLGNFDTATAADHNEEFNLSQYFTKSGLTEFDIGRASTTNLAHVSQSNLYI